MTAGGAADRVDGGRVGVLRTPKLFVGGAFPRSESGRSYRVEAVDGRFLGQAAQASRKDVRDAVVAARKALAGWSRRPAINRGQVLYRVAEVLEGRSAQLAAEVADAEGVGLDAARLEVAAAVDRWVWYAGWADKLASVLGSANAVAGPFFDFTVPEPVGVVGIAAPQGSSLLGLTSVLAPAIVPGGTAVVLVSEGRPIPAVSLAEVLATSDVPGGVVNLLTGRTAELLPVLAGHADVDALDLAGAEDPELRRDAELRAADAVTRVVRASSPPSWHEPPGTPRLRAAVELKTVWHPIGR